jgi:hypothetical protein
MTGIPEDGELLERVVDAARSGDPSIDVSAGLALADTCLRLLDEDPAIDPAELARRCFAEHGNTDASWCNYVAKAAVACR